jgi:hypothetical protein
VVVVAIVGFAQAQTPAPQRPPFPAIQLSRHLSGEEAIAALGDKLPALAAYYHRDPTELKKQLRQDNSLRLDRQGRLYHVCHWPMPAGEAIQTLTDLSTNGLVSLDQTFLLHSRPGATKTIYLDFNGFTISGTAWNTSHNGGADIIAPPWDTDGDPVTFGSAERTAIQRIWLRVAEDYIPYDVDVTTEDTGEAALTRTTTSDQVFGVRALVSAIGSYFGDPGGISYVGDFDNVGDKYKPSLIFPENLGNSEKNIAEAISHEVGHSLGLSHDGTTNGSSYYSGQGNWAPIMGVGYSKPITQWSRGEYATANNTQDDLTIITQNGLSFRADDHGNNVASATALLGAATNGLIERATDVDFFSVRSGAGTLQVTVSPSERGQNLHLFVVVYDGSGNLVTNREVADTSSGVQPVVISRTVAAGKWFVSVEGKGSGDPAATGYSDYASLGQYTVSVNAPAFSLARPTIVPAGISGTNFSLRVASQSGVNYVLQTTTNLTAPVAWQNLSTNTGNGGTLTLLAPVNSAVAKRFWRVLTY